jgi:MoxR-like ATPase
MTTDERIDVTPVQEKYARMLEAVSEVVVGQDEAVRLAFITLICSSHSLFEGVPGVAKTLLVKALARLVSLGFGRVQFTADLMPSDITGIPVFHPGSAEFQFREGPIFTDLLLADEINRASAKTQAALLEAMQERSVTVDGVRHALGDEFTVFATQNPVEQEGTYPLPEAELDRFLFKVLVGYPDAESEQELLRRQHGSDPLDVTIEPVLDRGELSRLRSIVSGLIVRDEIIAYVTELVRASRADVQYSLGASPRAGLQLLRAAKALAAMQGRDFVLPEDVQALWAPAMRHRIVLDPAAEVEGLEPDTALARTLASVTVPR